MHFNPKGLIAEIVTQVPDDSPSAQASVSQSTAIERRPDRPRTDSEDGAGSGCVTGNTVPSVPDLRHLAGLRENQSSRIGHLTHR